MNLQLLLITLLAVFLNACQPEATKNTEFVTETTDSVIGGDKVSGSDRIAKSTVGLYDEKNSSLCTGTLISDSLVLTAAHCVDPLSSKQIVYFGQDITKPNQSLVRKALRIVQHPLYNPKRSEDTYDIALIRFEGGIPAGFEPAPLLTDFSRISKGSSVIVAGYGLNWAWGIKRGAGVLRTVNLRVKSTVHGSIEMILDQSLKRGVCSGDSGGPAYVDINGKLHVLGVASRGDSIPLPLTPDCFILSIYTRVDAMNPWIQQTRMELMGQRQ